MIEYNGTQFPTKSQNGYTFATEELFTALTDKSSGDFLDSAAEEIDNKIAFYFDNEDFTENTPKQLLEIFNQHS